jgi:hypothetical protein
MTDKINYMSKKDEELMEYIEKYELDKNEFITEKGAVNRKRLNGVLKAMDLMAGRLKETLVSMPEEPVKEYEPTGSKLHKSLSGMMVSITFYNSDDNDLPYVQMALNGIALTVPREVQSWLPKEFVDGVLNNAVITRMKMDIQPDGKIKYIPKNIPRVQYTVHDIKHIDVLCKEYDEKNKK